MPSVAWNRNEWDRRHDWRAEGDEWADLAEYCGQPYGEWKRTLYETFIAPRVSHRADVLEIAPGRGRWTAYVAGGARSLTLVDLSPSCIDFCRHRFGEDSGIRYLVNDGSSLADVAADTLDFVFSIDSFVHMDATTVQAYLAEIARVLRPGGRTVLHHADKRSWSLHLVPMTSRAGLAGRLVQQVFSQGRIRDDGNRGNVSRGHVADMARAAGLVVEFQRASWGDAGQFNLTRAAGVRH